MSRDGVLDGAVENSLTGLVLHLVVFVAEGGEWLEMSIHKQDVSSLNIDERGRRRFIGMIS